MHGPSAEGALKMKEHCGIHTEACLSGELGSLSIVDTKQIATIMVVSKDSVHHKSLDVLRKIRSCNPTVVCGADDYEVMALSDNCVSVPNTVDCLQGILTVMALQLLTHHIARKTT